MQGLLNILGISGVYALISCGLVLIYRTSRVVSLAHGQLAILCLYIGAYLLAAGYMWTLSAVAAVAVGCAIGAVVHLLVMRRILGERPFVGLMTTIGIAIFVNGLIVQLFGGKTTTFAPVVQGTVSIGNLNVPAAHLYSAIAAWVVVAAVVALNYYSKLGLLMRAVNDHVVLAAQRGVRIDVVVGFAWIVSIGVAAAAGVFYGQRALITTSGVLIGVNGLIAALIGGMDSFKGAIFGALIVAAAEYFTVQFFAPRYAEMTPALLMLIILTFRPWGLFGTVEEVERV